MTSPRRWLSLLLLLLVVACAPGLEFDDVACAGKCDQFGPDSKEPAEWTLLVYAANDDDSEDLVAAFDQDIDQEIQRVLGGSIVFRILVERDYAPFQTTADGNERPSERFQILRQERYDPETNEPGAMVLGETDSASSKTIEAFLTYGIRRFPAKHYWVIITGHGDGWSGLAHDATSGYGHRMPISGLAEALRAGSKIIKDEIRPGLSEDGTSDRIDVVQLDVCRLGNIESLTSIADSIDYAVASQEIVPNAGHPYGALGFIGQNHPGYGPKRIVTEVVSELVRSYVSGLSTRDAKYVGNSVTSVGLDLRRLPRLWAKLRSLRKRIREERNLGFSCPEVFALAKQANEAAVIVAPRNDESEVDQPGRASVFAQTSIDLIALLEALADPKRTDPPVSKKVRKAANDVLTLIGRPQLWSRANPQGAQLQYWGQYRKLEAFGPDSPFVVEAHKVEVESSARAGGLSILWGDPYELLYKEDDGTTAMGTYKSLPFNEAVGWTSVMEACIAQAQACRDSVPAPDQPNPCEGLGENP